ncbi:hypothetical protein GQ464_005805 [Rhodocaloribacter litoris]|uniref:RAD55 family ATPase n=1 Tax=Rhodocaloribacter litoris TaxID=2558931 RepID=UPI00141E6E54|nr:ATPase domain-containing protein [Rhodocaloribacter litoris]QXD16464.1 hypothetical protein GQ464_005805 [Rhodocaloribacter litoris]
MSTLAPKLLSGIDVIDEQWGGLYRGGSYLVYGSAVSGRTLLPLMFIQTGVLLDDSCLLISPERPKDLTIQAASIGFDLRAAHTAGKVRLMRIPPLFNLQNVGDDGVARALHDLVAIIRQHQPDRLAITDFTPFVHFRSFDRMKSEFIHLLEQIDPVETTLMLALNEPASRQEEEAVSFIQNQMTGSIHITLVEGDTSTRRRLTLIPHIGHLRRVVIDDWDLTAMIATGEEIAASVRMLPGQRAAERKAAETTLPPPEAAPPPLEPPAFTIEPPSFIPVPPPEAPAPEPPPSEGETTGPEAFPPAEEITYEDREAFRDRLQQHFDQRDRDATPFLLLALRMDRSRGKTRPFDFEFILDLVSESLREQDAMLADTEKERLVVLLGDSRPEEAQRFFSRLKDRLRQEAPQQADHLLHAVSAIVVPDGRPFQNADEFLTYALDED